MEDCEMSYTWGYSSDLWTTLNQSLPCREKEVKSLISLIGEKSQMSPPCVFVYGHTSTGKTCVVNTIFKTLQLPHVLVNCVECYNARFLYEHILNNLPQSVKSSDHYRCDNMNDFVRQFQQIVKDGCLINETVYIVLDKAERLREMDANILPAFLRLQELTNLNMCVMLISEIVWEKYRTGTGYCDPYILHFPDYTKDNMVEIMSLDCPTDFEVDFYSNYTNLVLSIFHIVCRDLKELRHLTMLNFDKYIEPIRNGEATINDSRKLWRNIEPHLRKALQTVYLREVSSAQWERLQKEQSSENTGDSQTKTVMLSRSHVELPFYSKYLLIAGYLASYNPVKSDARFFKKRSAKMTKRAHLVKKKERASNHLLGPKPFPLDRLLAIFYSIVEGRVAPTANIFSQITSLVSLHLLGQTAGDDQIEMPKYKCLVSLDFIRSVSRTVNFEVIKYLYDFI
ncbi:origin recognition complex subunit 5 isoform X2 [Patella vulgata]|nr:origin recognition complex subunit 5 isoform X2 [Patella vulgata]XP_050414192.1 origin recognition complex subunit 5 isoform X2 [Patella vulgata]